MYGKLYIKTSLLFAAGFAAWRGIVTRERSRKGAKDAKTQESKKDAWNQNAILFFISLSGLCGLARDDIGRRARSKAQRRSFAYAQLTSHTASTVITRVLARAPRQGFRLCDHTAS
jgi:hypothetical protein